MIPGRQALVFPGTGGRTRPTDTCLRPETGGDRGLGSRGRRSPLPAHGGPVPPDSDGWVPVPVFLDLLGRSDFPPVGGTSSGSRGLRNGGGETGVPSGVVSGVRSGASDVYFPPRVEWGRGGSGDTEEDP